MSKRKLQYRLFAASLTAIISLASVSVHAETSDAPLTQPADARVVDDGWFAPEARTNTKTPPAKITKAFTIPIEGPISPTTYDTIKRKIARCSNNTAELIIFEMDTPGGRSDAMSDIVRLIYEECEDIYTVAYINPKAYSAGAVISLACDEIVVSPTARIGDAMPIMIAGGKLVEIPEKERGKIESAARSELRVSAKRNGYNVALCEAMITITDRIWLIKNSATGELKMIEAAMIETAEWQNKVSGVPGATTQPAGGDDANWQYVRTLDDENELVTLTADEAMYVGIAAHTLADIGELSEHYKIVGRPVLLEDTWSENLVYFLTSPAVAGILLFVGALCIYVEINTPGLGIPGTIAVICFAILFGSRFLIGMAAWWEIGLFFLGLILISVEVFVIPGFGIAGISGILCCVIGLLAILVNNPPDSLPIPRTNLDWTMFTDGVAAMMIGFLLACAAGALIGRFLPKVPFASKLLLEAPVIEPISPASEQAPIHRIHAGDIGTVEGPCRPVGQVRFGMALMDAIAEGQFIEAGTKVRATRIEGNRVVIAPVV